MANEEHLKLLKQGVATWNHWWSKNSQVEPDLSGANLERANLRGANLYNANLYGANLRASDLRGAGLDHANLEAANLYGANCEQAYFPYAYFKNADLQRANLSKADLRGAKLCNANLQEADLSEARLDSLGPFITDLSGANLSQVNLSRANLFRVHALDTNFTQARLTGSCIAGWHINSSTNLKGVICQHIFMDMQLNNSFIERRPHDPTQTFAPGEFAALVQKSLETVDLVFVDGIDWKAFFVSFQELQEKYRNDDLGIQAIEKKPGGAFVIRLEVAPDADKAAVEQDSKALYEIQLKILEAQYQELLRLQGDSLEEARRTIENERQDKTNLMAIIATMASNQETKYDLRGANFGGGFATEGGTAIGGKLNDSHEEIPHEANEVEWGT